MFDLLSRQMNTENLLESERYKKRTAALASFSLCSLRRA